MERIVARGNFITRNAFLVTVSACYVAALTAPAWGLGWGSPVLAPWAALLAALVLAGGWRYTRPGRSYPKNDLSFIIPVVVSVNLFSLLMGDGGEAIRMMNVLLLALCALYYNLNFNFAVAGLIFVLELARIQLAPGPAGAEDMVRLGVYGAYLGGVPLVLGRLFRMEYRKKERVLREYRKLKEGADTLNPEREVSGPMGSISETARNTGNADAAETLAQGLKSVLEAARSALRAGNAMIFMPDSGGETFSLRQTEGAGRFREDYSVCEGQGLVGWVIKEKKPLLARDRTSGLDYLEDAGAAGSFIAAPVLDGGRLEGVIALDSPGRDAFSEADRDSLELFGGIALHIIRDARVSHSVGQDANKFAALHKISSEVSSSLDIGAILDKLPPLIRSMVPYDYLTICFVDQENHASFRVVEGYGGAAMPEGPVPLENSYIGWIVDNSQPMPLNDFDRRTDRMPIFPVKELQADMRSFLGLPLINQDKVEGVLTVGLKRAGGIDGLQSNMLSIVAGHLAVNIANAKLHHKIKLMATIDGLTGLVNHRHFQEKADERFVRASRYPEDISLLLFDIDHFKKVNDTYGHPTGDAVLRKVGAIIREAVRTIDVAARYGGEEFAVLMENTNEDGAMKMAERIRSSIKNTRFVFEGRTVPVTVSIGCASYPSHCSDKKDLIGKADKSLYWAKENGRDKCCAFSSIAGQMPSSPENN